MFGYSAIRVQLVLIGKIKIWGHFVSSYRFYIDDISIIRVRIQLSSRQFC